MDLCLLKYLFSAWKLLIEFLFEAQSIFPTTIDEDHMAYFELHGLAYVGVLVFFFDAGLNTVSHQLWFQRSVYEVELIFITELE